MPKDNEHSEPQFDNPLMSEHRYGAVQHTVFIAKIKLAILGIVVLLVLLIIIMPLTDYGKPVFRLTFDAPKDGEEIVDNPTMMHPKLHGVDQKQQPYNMSAQKAVQLDKDTVELHKLEADIYSQSNMWLHLSSDMGVYSAKSREVQLHGAINVFVDNGYELNTESAQLFLKQGRVEGKESVILHGPMGVIRANGFLIKDGGDIISFLGGVHLTGYRQKELGN